MKTRQLFCICSYIFILPVLAYSGEAEKSLSLKEAIEAALVGNLNLRIQQEDINAARGATLSSQGKFDITFQAEAGAQRTEYTPLFIGAADQEDTTSFSAALSKTFSTGTNISFAWNNSSYDSDAETFTLNPSYNSGLNLEVRQCLPNSG